jgi:hypothetical protein
LKYNAKYRPAHDVIFAIMFGENSMFCRLAHAVTGEEIELLDKVYTQALFREPNRMLSAIRFDTFAELKDNRIITLDMERSEYGYVRLRRRQVFYAARAISTQSVKDMAYESIEPVNVVFVLTEHDYPYAIQKMGLTDLRTHELYDDLMNITVVYVKTVIKTYDEAYNTNTGNAGDSVYSLEKNEISADLYTFSRFFAISSQREADKFTDEFNMTELGKELINMYDAAVSDDVYLREIENSDYFKARLNETQLVYERERAERKGEIKGEQKATEKYILRLLNNYTPQVIADMLGVPLSQVLEVAAGAGSRLLN